MDGQGQLSLVNTKPQETRTQRTDRVLNTRMFRTLQQLRSVERLAGPTYEVSPVQASKIICQLLDAVCAIRARFEHAHMAKNGLGYLVD